MALQGTIDSFPLVDVLSLLSGSAKSGRLELVGDRGRAAVWVRDGEVVAGAAQGRPVPAAAEAVWEMLRFSDGSFEFVGDEEPPDSAFEAGEMAATVERATAMRSEWETIEQRVPSLEHAVVPVAELPGTEVRLSGEDWSMVVASGAIDNVGRLLDKLGLGEFGGCRRLAELVDRGLMSVSSPSRAPAPAFIEVPEQAPVASVDGRPDDGVSPHDSGTSMGRAEPAHRSESSEPAATQPHEAGVQDPGGHSQEPAAFPDHFPIDDLVGEPELSSWDQVAPTHPPAVSNHDRSYAPAPGAAPAQAFAPEGDAPAAGRPGEWTAESWSATQGEVSPGTPEARSFEGNWAHDTTTPGSGTEAVAGDGGAGGAAATPEWAAGVHPSSSDAPSAQVGHGTSTVSWDAAPETTAVGVQPPAVTAADAPPAAGAPAPDGAPAAEDDVLAQIGRLSPKAAEAIAAALGDEAAPPRT